MPTTLMPAREFVDAWNAKVAALGTEAARLVLKPFNPGGKNKTDFIFVLSLWFDTDADGKVTSLFLAGHNLGASRLSRLALSVLFAVVVPETSEQELLGELGIGTAKSRTAERGPVAFYYNATVRPVEFLTVWPTASVRARRAASKGSTAGTMSSGSPRAKGKRGPTGPRSAAASGGSTRVYTCDKGTPLAVRPGCLCGDDIINLCPWPAGYEGRASPDFRIEGNKCIFSCP